MNEEIEALLPFYAMDAVTEEERQQVESYISADPEAAARLQAFIDTAAFIPLTADTSMPSSTVKQALMQRVQADSRVQRPAASPLQTSPVQQSGLSFWQKLQTLIGSYRPAPVLTGLATLAALVAIIWSFSLRQQQATLEAELALQEELLSIYTSPAAQTIPVTSTGIQTEAVGKVTVDRSANRAILSVANLADNPDSVYQLWFIQGETPLSAGIFDVDATGSELYLVETAVPETFDAIGVSIEPPGGSSQPTGDIVLLGASPS